MLKVVFTGGETDVFFIAGEELNGVPLIVKG